MTSPLAACIALALVPGAVGAAGQEAWYRTSHNQQATGLSVLIVSDGDTGQWIRVSDLRLLDLPVPDVSRLVHAGEAMVPLSGLTVTAAIDASGQHLQLVDRQPTERVATEDLILDVVANGQRLVEPQIARRHGDTLWLSVETLEAARLHAPAGSEVDGWVPLHALAGDRYTLDPQQMRLDLTADPERFSPTRLKPRLGAAMDEVVRPVAPPGLILAYDIGSTRSAGGDISLTALLDATLSMGRASCRGRHLWHTNATPARLDTTCIVDWAERGLSLVLGDAISRDSSLTGSVRYGGFRFGTDFGLDPEMPTQPLLGVEGSARLPSVLEIWLGQQQVMRSDLPPGPFVVDGIAGRSGRGELQAVITDALGRRVLLEGSFYSSPDLLREGLTDWAVEAGRLREGFLGTSRYGPAFGLFTLRRGMSSFWTAEGRAEWQAGQALLGLTNYVTLGHWGILELSGAAQRGEAGQSRTAYSIGYSYQGYRWSLGLRHAAYDDGYWDLAWPVAGSAPLRDDQASVGVRLGRVSLSAGAIARDSGAFGEQRLLRAGLSARAGRGYLTISGMRTLQPAADAEFNLSYTLPLAQQRSASVWVSGLADALRPGVALQRSLPMGPGYGYRVLHEQTASGPSTQADVGLRGNAGAVSAYLYQGNSGTAARLGTSGALVASGQGVFLAADDGGSFAVVKMLQADVQILREHQVAATTRADGSALVSGLRPFERNRLGVQPESLDAASRIERSRIELIPGRRQVLLADFGASRVSALTLRVIGANGQPIPVGAVARSPATADETQVGYEGMLYLELIAQPSAVSIHWQDQQCTIAADALPDGPDSPQAYEVTCR